MPSLPKLLSDLQKTWRHLPADRHQKSALHLVLLVWLSCHSLPGLAAGFAATVRNAELTETDDVYHAEVEIEYHLSPTAKEALSMGVPLAFDVLIEIRHDWYLLQPQVYHKKIPYTLQFHALLNQYEVQAPGQVEMFLSLNAALNFMALLPNAAEIPRDLLHSGGNYLLAVKTEFNREALPIPLRPAAYLNGEWFLSSDWFIWPIQK